MFCVISVAFSTWVFSVKWCLHHRVINVKLITTCVCFCFFSSEYQQIHIFASLNFRPTDISKVTRLWFDIWYCNCFVNITPWSSLRREAPSSMSIQNLKQIALFVQKLLAGSHNFEVGSRDPRHGHLYFYIPYADGVRPPSLCRIWSRLLNSFKNY